jgi:hypothetical protein
LSTLLQPPELVGQLRAASVQVLIAVEESAAIAITTILPTY